MAGNRRFFLGVQRSRTLVIAAVIAMLAATMTTAGAQTSTPNCSGPILVDRGGTYSGCWVSNDPYSVAVFIVTTEPVELTNCVVKGPGQLVTQGVDHVKLTIRDCRFYGLYPGERGLSGDYAVEITGFDWIDFQHNYVEQKGGFKLKDWSGTSDRPPVTIKYNLAKNIDSRLADGQGGYLDHADGENRYHLQFVQLDKVQGAPGVEIAWNEVHNSPFQSSPEDNISIYKSGGTSDSPLQIYHNYIDGGYPPDPVRDTYSGGGILVGDSGGSWNVVRNNIVVATTNYGVAIAGGRHNVLCCNWVVASGYLADNRPVAAQNVGVYVWNHAADPAWSDNSAYSNAVGWSRPERERNDWWLPDCTGPCGNARMKDESEPVTREDEAAQRARWERRLAKFNVHIGPTRGQSEPGVCSGRPR